MAGDRRLEPPSDRGARGTGHCGGGRGPSGRTGCWDGKGGSDGSRAYAYRDGSLARRPCLDCGIPLLFICPRFRLKGRPEFSRDLLRHRKST